MLKFIAKKYKSSKLTEKIKKDLISEIEKIYKNYKIKEFKMSVRSFSCSVSFEVNEVACNG